MLPGLQTRFDALNYESQSVRQTAHALDAERLVYVPSEDEWSALQIVHHLLLSDETVGQPAAGVAPNKPFAPLLFRFALMALRRDVRLPIPDPALEPSNDVPLDVLLGRWDASRETLREFLEGVTDETQRYTPFSHPVIGPLTAMQLLELGATHTAYHRRQLERLVDERKRS